MHRHAQQAINGFETFVVGIFMLFQHTWIRDDPHSPVMHTVHHFADPYWVAIFITAGVIAIAVSFIPSAKWAHYAVNLLLGACWAAYFVAFVLQDLHFGPGVHLGTILSAFVFIHVLYDAYATGRRDRS